MNECEVSTADRADIACALGDVRRHHALKAFIDRGWCGGGEYPQFDIPRS